MIHVLIGTRAQLIKMIPLMHQLQQRQVEYNFIFMAQHRETIYEMLKDFGIKRPDYLLCDTGTDIVSSKQMIAWALKVLFQGIRDKAKIFRKDKNGIVLIHGDAPPLFLGALISKAQGLKVGSVEAGLRSFNLWKPFPEEITRVVTGKVGLIDVFYCQDKNAINNVKLYRGRSIHTRGNTIVDAIRLAKEVIKARNMEGSTSAHKYAVVTLHRFETISGDANLRLAMNLVIRISRKMTLKFILHPPTREALQKTDLYELLDNNPKIELLPRMNFIDFHSLISRAEFVVTDGGSNQEESAFLGIPCLLFRNETERFDGLGENVVLSRFDEGVIDDFIDNYTDFRGSISETDQSPTDIILEDVLRFA